MAEPQKPNSTVEKPQSQQPSISSSSRVSGEEAAWTKQIKYPNPPDPFNPDAVTLRDQWRFAIRQYSRWSSQAWGAAILAGVSFFALGWYIKGSNPLPSRHNDTHDHPPHPEAANSDR